MNTSVSGHLACPSYIKHHVVMLWTLVECSKHAIPNRYLLQHMISYTIFPYIKARAFISFPPLLTRHKRESSSLPYFPASIFNDMSVKHGKY